MPKTALDLTVDQLCDIAVALEGWICQGLQSDHDQARCLPTFLTLAKPSGLAYAMDLGGSNLRAALVRVMAGRMRIVAGPLERAMPWQRGRPFPRDLFFKTQTDLLAKLAHPQPLPLGYCFSYPTLSTPDRDAILSSWTKEIDVPDMVGHKIGRMLRDHLAAAGTACGRVAVINDTVATLVAGVHGSRADLHIGLVVGTGTNMAALIPGRRIAKAPPPGIQGDVPVNLESGNFHPPHLTAMDQALDTGSSDPGRQRLEKAVSGAYLGKLLGLCHPEARVDDAAGAMALMTAMAHEQRQPLPAHTAWRLYRRSALLTAATLAGLVIFLAAPGLCAKMAITAEGALMWSRPPGKPAYARLAGAALKQVLRRLNRSGVSLRFRRQAEANLKGSALAALIP